MTPSITLTATPKGLPIGALLALAMTGFICIVTETLPAGLLPLISEGWRFRRPWPGKWLPRTHWVPYWR